MRTVLHIYEVMLLGRCYRGYTSHYSPYLPRCLIQRVRVKLQNMDPGKKMTFSNSISLNQAKTWGPNYQFLYVSASHRGPWLAAANPHDWSPSSRYPHRVDVHRGKNISIKTKASRRN